MGKDIIIKKPELLSPAGDIKKAFFPIYYGADAIYIGTTRYSLRYSKNFSEIDELRKLRKLTYKYGKKIYLTTNIFMHNEDLINFFNDFSIIDKKVNPDSYIISDPALVLLLKNKIKNKKIKKNKKEIHLSTQANTLNYKTVEFWYKNGIDRVILGRELTLNEIRKIKEYIDNKKLNIKIETFIHGAMCISYSGRCLLSFYMTSPNLSKNYGISYRDSNKGMCVHPCRWEFKVIEKKRDGEIFDVIEDENYTYFMSSKDLCLLKYIPFLIMAGIDSFKIEGRMKSEFYQGITTYIYKKAIDYSYELIKDLDSKDIDNYFLNKDKFFNDFSKWVDFVNKHEMYLNLYSHRPYSTGFYFIDNPLDEELRPTDVNYQRDSLYLGYSITNYDLFNLENREEKSIFKFILNNIFDLNIEFINKIKDNMNMLINKIENKNNVSLFYCKNMFKINEKIKVISKDIDLMENFIIEGYDLELSKVDTFKHSNFYFIISKNSIPNFSFLIKDNL